MSGYVCAVSNQPSRVSAFRRGNGLWGWVVGWLLVWSVGLAMGREPPPLMQDQAKKLGEIKRLFKPEYAKSAPADRVLLAQTFITQAQNTKDDAVGRYVLLSQAVELAAGAGAAEQALQAIELQAQNTLLDVLPAQLQALSQAQLVATATEQEVIARAGLTLLENAIAADDYEQGQRIITLTQAASAKAQKVELTALLEPKAKELSELAAEYVLVKLAKETLEKTPNDPAANLTVGKYYGYSKGQWDYALTYLAKGADPQLQKLAAQDLDPRLAADGPALVKLADTWWELAENMPGRAGRNVRKHAQERYQTASGVISGLTLKRINERIVQTNLEVDNARVTRFTSDAAPREGAGKEVDLLALVEVEKDVPERGGKWQLREGKLCSDSTAQARVELPYFPPEEYDLQVTFSREVGDGPVVLLLTGMDQAFGLSMDARGHVARFEAVNNKLKKDNPTVAPCTLGNGQKYMVTVQVRKAEVVALLDGKPLCRFAGEAKALSRASGWKLGHNRTLGLGAQHSEVRFGPVKLVEVSAAGKKLRGETEGARE